MAALEFWPGPLPEANLEILAVIGTKYAVRYGCCGREELMQHISLVRRIQKGKGRNGGLACQACKGNRIVEGQKVSLGVTSGAVLPKGWALPLWPVPASLVGQREWWGR